MRLWSAVGPLQDFVHWRIHRICLAGTVGAPKGVEFWRGVYTPSPPVRGLREF